MKTINLVGLSILILSANALSQGNLPRPSEDQPIRISTQLIQLDAVVTDKNGRIVRGLTKDDFELYEGGKKQLVSFFEFVDAAKGQSSIGAQDNVPTRQPSGKSPGAADIRRIFAFVIDDLETRYSDLVYVRDMLTNFVNTQMQPGDLVAIMRTLGGKGLLQQFTTDKDLLRRAIASLGPMLHELNAFNPANADTKSLTDIPAAAGKATRVGPDSDDIDTEEIRKDSYKILRAYMSLGTATFVIDSMRQLPGRKSMILVSSGLPLLSANRGNSASSISAFFNSLVDKATRAGVAINTIDVRGLSAQMGVASFEDTPATSSTGAGGGAFGRVPDDTQFGYKNPFDVIEAHQGLRILASETGGISVLNKNDLNEGLARILGASEAYYLLAYTPPDSNFKGEFRKVEIRVKKKDLKVYGRSGYIAREEQPAAAPVTKQEQVLAAIKSPLARRDVDFEATIQYRAAQPDKGSIDISILLDLKNIQFEAIGEYQTSYEVVGFVFDELGKLHGGFSNTINASLTPDDYSRATKAGGLPFTTSTTLPAGAYQLRLAVRDNKTGSVGTFSSYLEVPDLSKGRLAASSLLLGSTPPGDMKGDNSTPLSANRRVSRNQDLRYAVVVYNPKLKAGKPQLQTQLVISQNGQVIYKEAEQMITTAGDSLHAIKLDVSQAIRIGQLGLARVKPGRYTATLVITDSLADKKAQTITRSTDFVVVD